MPTESSVYENHIKQIIHTLEMRVILIENQGHLNATDEIELAAIDRLLDRLDTLEPFDA